MMARRLRPLLCALLALPAATWATVGAAASDAGAEVSICYNYGCASEGRVRVHAASLRRIGARLAAARSAAQERELLAEAVGGLYRVAATQTAVATDRAGNLLDEGADGRMDCIDHSTTTTRLLQLLEARGALRFHRVLEPARRTRLILQHFSAVVEVLAQEPAADAPALEPAMLAAAEHGAARYDVAPEHAQAPATAAGERFAIDAWFVDHGEPAVVLPLDEWLKGGGPNVH